MWPQAEMTAVAVQPFGLLSRALLANPKLTTDCPAAQPVISSPMNSQFRPLKRMGLICLIGR